MKLCVLYVCHTHTHTTHTHAHTLHHIRVQASLRAGANFPKKNSAPPCNQTKIKCILCKISRATESRKNSGPRLAMMFSPTKFYFEHCTGSEQSPLTRKKSDSQCDCRVEKLAINAFCVYMVVLCQSFVAGNIAYNSVTPLTLNTYALDLKP